MRLGSLGLGEELSPGAALAFQAAREAPWGQACDCLERGHLQFPAASMGPLLPRATARNAAFLFTT